MSSGEKVYVVVDTWDNAPLSVYSSRERAQQAVDDWPGATPAIKEMTLDAAAGGQP